MGNFLERMLLRFDFGTIAQVIHRKIVLVNRLLTGFYSYPQIFPQFSGFKRLGKKREDFSGKVCYNIYVNQTNYQT